MEWSVGKLSHSAGVTPKNWRAHVVERTWTLLSFAKAFRKVLHQSEETRVGYERPTWIVCSCVLLQVPPKKGRERQRAK